MISVIIPVLNEEQALPATLANVIAQSSHHEHNDLEIIVVDGGSQDRTQSIASNTNGVVLINARRGRASQMNAGAAVACGEWLLFLHADTLLADKALQAIESLTPAADQQAGCFHQRFSKDHWFLRQVSRLHNWRCQRTRIMYGDQAMFIRRQLFDRIGGFPEQTILEDVLISELILEHVQPVFLQLEVVTSSRKFEQRGLFRSFFDIFVIMSCYELRLPIIRQGFFAAFR